MFADNAWDDSDFTRKEVRQFTVFHDSSNKRSFNIYMEKPVRQSTVMQMIKTIKASDTLKHQSTGGLVSALRMRTAVSPRQ